MMTTGQSDGEHEPCSWRCTPQNTLSFLFDYVHFDAPPCAQAEKKKKETSAARCNAVRRLMGRTSLQIPVLGRRISSARRSFSVGLLRTHGRVGKVSTKQSHLPSLALIQISDSSLRHCGPQSQTALCRPRLGSPSPQLARRHLQTQTAALAVGPGAGLGYPHCRACAGTGSELGVLVPPKTVWADAPTGGLHGSLNSAWILWLRCATREAWDLISMWFR